MKRLLSLFLIILIVVSTMSGCGNKYEKTVDALSKIEINSEDPGHLLSEDLVKALKNAEYTKPKNIIFMIGDGMGEAIIDATEVFFAEKLYDGKLAINHLTNKGYSRTRSANSAITDSAAGGTALSTGYRTNNGVVGMSPNLEENYQNVLELAAKKKKSTGIIATKAVTDATPAAFSAHVKTRALQEEIASQQIKLLEDGTLDILLGGGHVYYRNNKNIELLEEACKKGVTLTDIFSDTLKASLPSIGLFAMEALDSSDSPSLAAMTHLALNKLSENKKGFFLMVEGSKIDTYGHQNNIYREINEMWDFDEAIAVAMHFVAQNPDTILIITADHETGGLTLPDEPTKANIGECTYKTVDHTSKNVPVFAVGYGTEKLACEQDNTEIAKFIIKTLKK